MFLKEHNRNELMSHDFIRACRDYYYLIDHGFPERGTLKLVGDRYSLGGVQRTVLYRGITSGERSALRRSKLISTHQNQVIILDGYNVLFTLLNYRLGHFTFICTDGILRDAGSLHGKFRDEACFRSCIQLLIGYLKANMPGRAEIVLDSPVSHSEKHADVIRMALASAGIAGDCRIAKSADFVLKHAEEGVLATSDSVIIEKSNLPVVDLPRTILEKEYRAEFVRLGEII